MLGDWENSRDDNLSSGDLKSEASIACTTTPPPAPECQQTTHPPELLRTLCEVLHELHTIKIRIHHCNDEIVFVSDLIHAKMPKKPYYFRRKWAKLQTITQKYSIADFMREIW